jgi:glutathione peroxidase
MTIRQKLMNTFYPALISGGKLIRLKAQIRTSPANIIIPVSFYSLEAIKINGQPINFNQFKGKKVLIVNTASDCGYTPQLGELQKLQDQFENSLKIIAFPSNEFKEQEPGSNEEIAAFCSQNFNVGFILTEKTSVRKTNIQHKVYEWLTHEFMNGWNNYQPSWNFTKYLIDENGKLTHIFGSGISPLDSTLTGAIEGDL